MSPMDLTGNMAGQFWRRCTACGGLYSTPNIEGTATGVCGECTRAAVRESAVDAVDTADEGGNE